MGVSHIAVKKKDRLLSVLGGMCRFWEGRIYRCLKGGGRVWEGGVDYTSVAHSCEKRVG